VQRLRDELLARAGLCFDEHRRIGRRDSLEHREHAPHRDAIAEQSAEPRARRQRQIDLALEEAQPQRRAAEHDQRIRARPRIAHTNAIDRRAVAAIGIDDANAVAIDRDCRVVPAHRRIGEYEIAGASGAHLDRGTGELDDAPAVGTVGDLDVQLAGTKGRPLAERLGGVAPLAVRHRARIYASCDNEGAARAEETRGNPSLRPGPPGAVRWS
jgi:hypothetical protein